MTNVLILNGHHPFPSSPGHLTRAYVERATDYLTGQDAIVKCVETRTEFDLDREVENQLWADFILVQFPVNSMGMPWSLKRYLDEVYTAGMDGRLAKGDGRSRRDPSKQYGSGGKMTDTAYMLSVTLNAPSAAFNDDTQTLFAGRSVDDLLAPAHINFAFFGLQALPTFAAHDVNKNPTIEADFTRFDQQLAKNFARLT